MTEKDHLAKLGIQEDLKEQVIPELNLESSTPWEEHPKRKQANAKTWCTGKLQIVWYSRSQYTK
jgi:hypothetical protein